MKRPVTIISVQGGTTAVTEKIEHRCSNCMYYDEIKDKAGIIEPEGRCHRYPKPHYIDHNYWCGEFKHE